MKHSIKSSSKFIPFALLLVSISATADTANGKKIYDRWCAHCHDAGSGYAGTMMLTLTRDEGVIKNNSTLDPDYIETVVRKGLGMMPMMRKTEIGDADLADLISYIKNN